jgi:hypothetical protein
MLHRQLDDAADVTESKFLPDPETGGDLVEVDVTIETKSTSGIPFTIGIECQDRGRKATVEWVRAVHGKHKSLAIDKSVLVAKSGFTKQALRKARSLNMETLTIEEAKAAPWADYVGALQLRLGCVEHTSLATRFTLAVPEAFTSAPPVPMSALVLRGGMPNCNVHELITAVLGRPEILKQTFEHWRELPEPRPETFKFSFSWKPASPAFLQLDEGQFLLAEMYLEAQATVSHTPISLSAGGYLGKDVAYGTAANIFHESADKNRDVVVTLVGAADGVLAGSLVVPKFEGGPDRVLPMKISKREPL